MLPYLKRLDMLGYPYYFEMTITGYREDMEPNVPSTEEAMATFMLLSERIGRERMDLRVSSVLWIIIKEVPLLNWKRRI